jgi:hypothetical protein
MWLICLIFIITSGNDCSINQIDANPELSIFFWVHVAVFSTLFAGCALTAIMQFVILVHQKSWKNVNNVIIKPRFFLSSLFTLLSFVFLVCIINIYTVLFATGDINSLSIIGSRCNQSCIIPSFGSLSISKYSWFRYTYNHIFSSKSIFQKN